ncbi:hypothetical protein PGN35_023935 [Nodosilinea sp. PGN35]|uniref:hypothetical protein n=1 Tax=Nodosilinea sp. PGN35 TaxID=3020489 RepID=UPI0023B35652|nr:hypothetical protein [Nodosilinea sp. TSF1-S3]MDF0370065.1 hypothetical protein [Nodosilinea sp. TSF1-S3]
MTTQTAAPQSTTPTLLNARDLGDLVPATATHSQTYNRDIVGHNIAATPVDYYRFVLHQPATLTVSWAKESATVPLRLMCQSRHTDVVKPKDWILATRNPAHPNQPLHLEGLGAGTYFLEVGRDLQGIGSYGVTITAQVGLPQVPATADVIERATVITGHLHGKREFAGAMQAGPQASRFYRFTLTQAVEFKAVATPGRGMVQLALYHHDRNDQRLEAVELLDQSIVPNAQPQVIERRVLTPGTYYLRVRNPARTGTTAYQLSLEATLRVEGKVHVTLHEIRALQQFDSRVPFTNWHEADFFGTVKIGDRTFKFGPFADSDVVKNQSFIHFVDPNQRFVPVNIEINDEDNNGHDRADIAPERGVQHLALRYDTLKREIIGVTGFKERYKSGTIIRLRGTGGDWTHNKPLTAASYATELTFSVQYAPLSFHLSYDPF